MRPNACGSTAERSPIGHASFSSSPGPSAGSPRCTSLDPTVSIAMCPSSKMPRRGRRFQSALVSSGWRRDADLSIPDAGKIPDASSARQFQRTLGCRSRQLPTNHRAGTRHLARRRAPCWARRAPDRANECRRRRRLLRVWRRGNSALGPPRRARGLRPRRRRWTPTPKPTGSGNQKRRRPVLPRCMLHPNA